MHDGDRAEPRARAQEHAAGARPDGPLRAPLRRHVRVGARCYLQSLALDGIFITELEPGDGIRLAVKDLFDTAGVRTTYGSAVFAEHVPVRDGRGGAPARGRRATRTSARRTCTSSPTASPRRTSTTGRCRTRRRPAAPRAARAAARRRRSPPGSPTRRSAPTRAARSGSPPRAAGSSASSRRYGLVPTDGVFPLAPSFDHAGPMARDVAGCAAMMEALVPGFAAEPVGARRRCASASPGATRADPLVRARASRRRPRVPGAEPVDAPARRTAISPLFMREVADVHRELYRRAGRALRRERRPEDRALPRGDRRRGGGRGRGARAPTASGCASCARAVRPAADADARVRRARRPTSTRSRRASASSGSRSRSTRSAGRRSRCRAAPAEDGLPASVQLVGRPGDDALVLAAGLALEAALKR